MHYYFSAKQLFMTAKHTFWILLPNSSLSCQFFDASWWISKHVLHLAFQVFSESVRERKRERAQSSTASWKSSSSVGFSPDAGYTH